MFVERKVRYSTLFTNLVRWHVGAISFPIIDIILAQLACPRVTLCFCLHSGITNLSLYKHGLLTYKLAGVEMVERPKLDKSYSLFGPFVSYLEFFCDLSLWDCLPNLQISPMSRIV
jgi:hypothetical protein